MFFLKHICWASGRTVVNTSHHSFIFLALSVVVLGETQVLALSFVKNLPGSRIELIALELMILKPAEPDVT